MAQGGSSTAALRLPLAQRGVLVLLLVLLLVLQGWQLLAQAGLRGVLGCVLVLLPQCVCVCVRACGDLQQQRCLQDKPGGDNTTGDA
jgi:F0F1-type ATP synthase assembly protein I